MKQLLCAALLVGSLTSCSHNEPAPTPTLLGERWTLQSKITVATPKDGSAPTTTAYPIMEKVTMTFQSATRFQMEMSKPSSGGGKRFEGAYSYQEQTFTFPAISA